MRTRGPQVVWIYGPPGVGKSTMGWALFDQFTAAGLSTAYVDIDQAGMCYPPQESDPERHHVKARNVGRVLKKLPSRWRAEERRLRCVGATRIHHLR
jgi:adenylylsulfate kinase-like enzyme